MRKKTKSLLSSIIFISLCFLTFAASLFYFFTDLNRTTVRNDKQIATIEFKKKIAQRKFSDSVIWERLQNTSPLYNEDIIRTDAAASATLKFDDTEVSVDLDEKTMLQIFSGKNGELKISVSGGNFTVDTTEASSAIKIDLGNSIINLEKGSRLSASNSDGKSAIVISEGTGSITNDNGEEEFILAGDTVKIDEKGSKTKIPVTVTNMDVPQKYLVFEGKKQDVEIKLNVASEYKNQKIIMDVSDASDFSSVKESTMISADESFTMSCAKGTFFYRIYPENMVSDAFVGKIIVNEIKVPMLISPYENFTYESINAMPDINFVWDSGLYCDFSRLEIYSKDDTSKPLISKEISDDSVKISTLGEGKYYWKIVPHYSGNGIGFKDIVELREFSVVKQQASLTPELSVPAMGSNIVLGNDEKNILFACKSDIKKSDFRFELSKDKNFEEEIIYSTTEENVKRLVPFKLSEIPEGKYFWRVVRIDENKKEYFSSVRDFTVSEYVPKITQLIFPPENYSVERSRLSGTQFIWSLSDSIDKNKTQCVIEIAEDENFSKNLKRIASTGISYTGVNVHEGKYYWRVKALNTDDNSEVAKTDVRVINVINGLEIPEIVAPVNNASLTKYDNGSVNLSWKDVAGSDYYIVKIFDEKNNSLIEQFESVKTNSLNVNLPSDRQIKCTVQAFSDEKENAPARNSKTSEVSFRIKSAQKIILAYPQNNAKIDGLQALRRPVVFNWKEDGSRKNKEFILTRVYPDGTSKVITTVKNPADSVSVKRLVPGLYRWTVNASTKDGISLSPDSRFTFTVTAIPELSAAKLNAPANNFEVDVNYLRANRNIKFEWNPVPGATDYTFVLYQKNDNGTLRRIVSEKTEVPSYTLKDLKLLDVGTFEWHVTAYLHASDGYEEQKGKDSSSLFTVNFDLPDTIKVKDPGRMYAE